MEGLLFFKKKKNNCWAAMGVEDLDFENEET